MLEELIQAASFYAFAGLAVLAAVGAVFGKNLLHCALLLTLTFLCVAGLYFWLDAGYIGAAQALIYAGAVAVLIIMGIMITRRKDMAHSNPDRRNRFAALLLSCVLCGVLLVVFVATPIAQAVKPVLEDTVSAIADLLLLKYVLSFEIAAVLLLAAMLGAIVLAKGADEQ